MNGWTTFVAYCRKRGYRSKTFLDMLEIFDAWCEWRKN